MQVFIIILVIYAIFNGIAKKKKREAEQARRAAALRQAQGTQAQPAYGDPRFPNVQGSAGRAGYDPRFPNVQGSAERAGYDPRFPDVQMPLAEDRRQYTEYAAEGSIEGGGLSEEGRSRIEPLHEAEQYRKAPMQQRHKGHVVTSSTQDAKTSFAERMKTPGAALEAQLETLKSSFSDELGGGFVIPHSHSETSLTGVDIPCPPVLIKPNAETKQSALDKTALLHTLISEKQGLVSGIIFSEILGKPKAMRRA